MINTPIPTEEYLNYLNIQRWSLRDAPSASPKLTCWQLAAGSRTGWLVIDSPSPLQPTSSALILLKAMVKAFHMTAVFEEAAASIQATPSVDFILAFGQESEAALKTALPDFAGQVFYFEALETILSAPVTKARIWRQVARWIEGNDSIYLG